MESTLRRATEKRSKDWHPDNIDTIPYCAAESNKGHMPVSDFRSVQAYALIIFISATISLTQQKWLL